MDISITKVFSTKRDIGRISAVNLVGGNVVTGLDNGQVNVWSREGELERSFAVNRAKIESLVSTKQLLAVMLGGRVVLYDIESWKMVSTLSTSSAFQTTVIHNSLVVASKYKIRYIVPNTAKESTWDVPDGQRIRAIAALQDKYVILLLDSNVLIVLDPVTEKVRMKHSTGLSSPAKDFRTWSLATVTGSTSSILIQVGRKAQMYSMNEGLKFSLLSEFDTDATDVVSLRNIYFLLVSPKASVLMNPETGNTITSHSAAMRVFSKCNSADGYLGFAVDISDQSLVEIDVNVDLGSILALAKSDLREAVSQAELAGLSDPQIATLQQQYAAQLVNEGNTEVATRRLTAVETAGIIPNSAIYGVEVIEPIIAAGEAAADADMRASADDSDTRSVLSFASSAPRGKAHPLDCVVSYLLVAKRRLKLRSSTGTDPEVNKVVDTALFRCYMAMRSPLVAPLLRSKNYCDSDVVTSLLEAWGKWRELAGFLRSRNLHREALALLVKNNESPDKIVSYLETCTANDFELTTEFSRDLVTERPKYAEVLFWDSFLDRSYDVLIFLKKLLSDLEVEKFLLHRIHELGDKTPEIHENMALLYYRKASPQGCDQLRTFLSTDPYYYRPHKLLDEIKADADGRALLFWRLGDYKAAIDVFLARSPIEWEAAESFATKYSTGNKGLKYLFDKMLELSPEKLSGVLNRHSQALVDEPTFEKIPGDIGLINLQEYLVSLVRGLSRHDRLSDLSVALERVELTDASSQYIEARRESWIVTPSTACVWCQKRLGKSVLGIYHHQVVHYGCLQAELDQEATS